MTNAKPLSLNSFKGMAPVALAQKVEDSEKIDIG